MKHIFDYILEAEDSKCSCEKPISVTFNFSGVDGVEDLFNSLEDMEYVYVDKDKSTVTVTISNDNCDKLETPMDILQQTIQLERNSTKTTNNEQYAQKIKALEKSLEKVFDTIDCCCGEDE